MLDILVMNECACLGILSTGLQLWDRAIFSGAGTTI